MIRAFDLKRDQTSLLLRKTPTTVVIPRSTRMLGSGTWIAGNAEVVQRTPFQVNLEEAPNKSTPLLNLNTSI